MNARPPAGAALWTATIGNTLLALPAPVGLMYARTVGSDAGLLGMGDSDPELMVLVGGAILLGLLLVAGYWRAALRGGPGPWPRVFWSVSAAYNLGAAGFWVTQLADELNPSALLLLAWTLFMGGLSLARLRQPAVAVTPAPP